MSCAIFGHREMECQTLRLAIKGALGSRCCIAFSNQSAATSTSPQAK